MNRFVSLCLILVALVASSVQGFAPSNLGGVSGGELSNHLMFAHAHVMSSISKAHIPSFT